MSEQEFPCPPQPEPNKCGGYYCSEEHGHIDCAKNWECKTCGWKGLDLDMGQAPEYHRRWNSKEGKHCPGNLIRMIAHFDCTPGLTMEGVVFELLPNHGKRCWKASAQIGTIFGSVVHGELIGFGPTKEAALEKLHDEQRKLHESLWI